MACPFFTNDICTVSIYLRYQGVQDCFHQQFKGIASVGNGGSRVTVLYFRQVGPAVRSQSVLLGY